MATMRDGYVHLSVLLYLHEIWLQRGIQTIEIRLYQEILCISSAEYITKCRDQPKNQLKHLA